MELKLLLPTTKGTSTKAITNVSSNDKMDEIFYTFKFDWAFDLSNIDQDWYEETRANEWVKNYINID